MQLIEDSGMAPCHRPLPLWHLLCFKFPQENQEIPYGAVRPSCPYFKAGPYPNLSGLLHSENEENTA